MCTNIGMFSSMQTLLTLFPSYMPQGQCGASYAFSAIGALEGAWALAHGKLTLLSEQNIIDCSGEEIIILAANYLDIPHAISQYHTATMAVGEGTCTMPTSTSLPMMESQLPAPIPL